MSIVKTGKTGILLLGFGAPLNMAQVGPFITHIFRGKNPPGQVILEMKARYQAIGGSSPYLAATITQGKKLEESLRKLGQHAPVYLGMLHSEPFIADTVDQMVRDGIEQIIGITLAPFYSKVSTGAYQAETEKRVNAYPQIKVDYLDHWHSQPFFIKAWARKITEVLQDFPPGAEVPLIFTAHSLPSDPPDDAACYEKQFQETVQLIINKLAHKKFHLAYQSKGKRPGHWLGPQVEEMLDELSAQGEKQALIAPVGFISDHMETLYDLDIELKKPAKLGKIDLRRTSALNDDHEFIQGLAELVLAMK